MPRISFLDIVTYLESLATKHADINESYRWNVLEASGAMRTGVKLPLTLIDSVETQTAGDNTKTIHKNTTAFTILGKPNTPTAQIDAYAAQNETLDHCQKISFEMEARIIHDAQQIKDANGNKDTLGATPAKLTANGYKVYKYVDHETLARRIEEAASDAGK